VEFVAPAVSSASLGQSSGAELATIIEADMLLDNPQVKYVDLMQHGYLVLDVTGGHVQSDWYYLETILEPSDVEVLGASWEVLDGENHLVEASGAAPAGTSAPATPGAQPRVAAATAAPPAGGRTLPATGASGGFTAGALVAGAALGARFLERRSRLLDEQR
jgi:hypothetical protein